MAKIFRHVDAIRRKSQARTNIKTADLLQMVGIALFFRAEAFDFTAFGFDAARADQIKAIGNGRENG